MNKKYIIYAHKSKTTGKCYIGQTCREFEKRWGSNGNQYTKNHNLKFYNAIQKYGWNDFDHFIIDSCETLKDAYELEQFYIELFDSFRNGYNSTLGGAGSKGKKMTNATREKLIKANKGKVGWQRYAPKEKMSMFGRHHTEETKIKIGNANRGKKMSLEVREKMRLAKFGKKGAKRTEETKFKMSIRKMGENNPMYGKHTNNKPNSKIPVIQLDINGNIVNEYESINDAERKTGIAQIGRAIKRKIKAGNFLWKKKTLN